MFKDFYKMASINLMALVLLTMIVVAIKAHHYRRTTVGIKSDEKSSSDENDQENWKRNIDARRADNERKEQFIDISKPARVSTARHRSYRRRHINKIDRIHYDDLSIEFKRNDNENYLEHKTNTTAVELETTPRERNIDARRADNEIKEQFIDISKPARVSTARHRSYRRRHINKIDRIHYDDLSIEFRRNDNENYLEHKTNTTVVEMETTPTTNVYPPLNLKNRRIYNPDEEAKVEQYPFLAAVLVHGELWCGAVIIDKDRVLTAAHCLQLLYNNRIFREYVKLLTVRVGSSNATSGGELLEVKAIDFHPRYDPNTLQNNLAVLRLYKNVTLDIKNNAKKNVKSIKLRKESMPGDSQIQFLGWGSVLSYGSTGGKVLLQKVSLPIYNLMDCQRIYGQDLVTKSNFCAGFITSITKNVCNHDAGGPAIYEGKLAGILSFSSSQCNLPDIPAVFTSVISASEWLEMIMKKP